MRAVVCRGYESPGETALETVASPAMVYGSVRIAVHAAGVSFANLLVLKGQHQNRSEPPFTPGTEVAGVVLECDPSTGFKPGDRVVAGLRTGGFAEEAVVPARTVFALPGAVDFDAAVQFPTIYGTAYGALMWRARMPAGATLLVHGAAGGSGLAAVEIGKVLGARVIATAGSAEKVAAALAHGADHVIDYRAKGFRDEVLALTDGRGADVIFDPVGGATFDESLRCIAPEGCLIPMGFAGGTIPQVAANLLLVKNVTVIGIYWGYYMGWGRQRPPLWMAHVVRDAFDQLLAWTADGRLRPVTHQCFALADFRAALDMLTAREVIGRVVLHPLE